MLKQEELELFEYLGRQPKFRQWLNEKLDSSYEILVLSPEIDQLRKAQGRCSILIDMLGLMDKAPAALKPKQG